MIRKRPTATRAIPAKPPNVNQNDVSTGAKILSNGHNIFNGLPKANAIPPASKPRPDKAAVEPKIPKNIVPTHFKNLKRTTSSRPSLLLLVITTNSSPNI